jgi:hypothetical protein
MMNMCWRQIKLVRDQLRRIENLTFHDEAHMLLGGIKGSEFSDSELLERSQNLQIISRSRWRSLLRNALLNEPCVVVSFFTR